MKRRGSFLTNYYCVADYVATHEIYARVALVYPRSWIYLAVIVVSFTICLRIQFVVDVTTVPSHRRGEVRVAEPCG